MACDGPAKTSYWHAAVLPACQFAAAVRLTNVEADTSSDPATNLYFSIAILVAMVIPGV